MTTARQNQKLNTRKRIMETACSVFSQRGFSAPTSSIAKEAGISHGTIFVHFPTANDLVNRALEDFSERVGHRLHVLSAQSNDVEDLLKEHLNLLEENEALYARLISEFSSLPEDARSSFAIMQSTAAFHFGIVMEREKEKGAIKGLPLHMLFHTWLGLIHYYLMNRESFSEEDGSVIKKYRAEWISAYLQMIGREGAEKI